MALKSLTPNMIVEDVAASAEYYRDALGFQFVLGVPEGTQDTAFELGGQPLAFAMMQNGNVELMFQSTASVAADLPDYRPGGGDVVALYIDVDDVDALHERVADKVTIVQDLTTTFYGAREFHIRDCNGLIVGFARRPRQG